MTETIDNAMRLGEGGLIDRDEPLRFTFNGSAFTGYQGDTLASALLANGVKVLGRSFKFHRPRGVFSCGEEEPCALVEIGEGDARVPTCRAPAIPLHDGMMARSQNCWPNVNFDAGRIIDFTHAFWPAGFYNKTFKWPNWHTWEGLIRKSAGLGRPLTGPDPDHYEQVNAHCDLLICGGGPAGLQAALTAGRAGLRVMLVEQGVRLGGTLLWERTELNHKPAIEWVSSVVSELSELSNVIMLPSTTVSGIYDHGVTTLLQTGQDTAWRECFWTIRPKQTLLTTGAIEQGLIFPANDRPGIMLASAARQYLNRFAVKPGNEAIVCTNNDSAYQTVFDLAEKGIRVTTVVDARPEVGESIRRRLAETGTYLLPSARIRTTYGSKGISAVRVEDLQGNDLGRRPCDLLAVSGGWAPRVHLLAHARGSLRFEPQMQSFLPDQLPMNLSVAGSANGCAHIDECLQEATDQTIKICAALGVEAIPAATPETTLAPVVATSVAAIQINTSRTRQWIDLAHDVTLGDAELAVREGYVSVEHFKRYTTTGMSVDQGKTGNLNAFIVLGALTGQATGEVGTTTFRPPYMPVTLGAIAGRNIDEFYTPRRYLPAHVVHAAHDARFEDYGWQRPDCYLRNGESLHEAVQREVLAVRNDAGVFDNSPIGKIEVRGPDAAEFLHRIYINDVLSLPVGRIRYGLMLNENGVIIDDGVFARLAEDHFLLNTTSAGLHRIHSMLEEWLQCEWTDLQVVVDDVTSQWATFTVAGPRARSVLEALSPDIDLSPDALPHMSVTQAQFGGLQSRLLRVSYSGELSYEISIPSRQANGFLATTLEAGRAFGITLYGIEALMMLRMEKGFLHVGTDTDGSSTPDDIGWGPVARRKKADFIGKRSLYREANESADRKQLVGLEPLEAGQALRPGGHLLAGENRQPPAETDGWITSAGFSPTLGRHIALGVIRDGRQKIGQIMTVCDEDERFSVKVVFTPFYDPENNKLSG